MKIGVVSDTHGFFDPQLSARFTGLDHIVHCGDIGDLAVIERLRSLAPTTAVLGNVDQPHLEGVFPSEVSLEFAGVPCYVRHQGAKPEQIGQQMQHDFRAKGTRVFMFGHSHQWLISENDGILFFNPGSAGRKRFDLPRTAGLLHINGAEVQAEVFSLEQ